MVMKRAARVLMLSFSPAGEVHTKEISLGNELCWIGGWDDIGQVLLRLFYAAFLGLCAPQSIYSSVIVFQSYFCQNAVVYSLFLLFYGRVEH